MRSRILSIGLASLLIGQALRGRAIAQPIPDDSLGAQSSVVVDGLVNGLPAYLIEGGAQRSQNLFHSFQEFSVNAGQRVYFNPAEDISAIFSRVSGDLPSNINGVLGVEGTAALYFLNPNGITFGTNASLDISGSFFATTSDRLPFEDGYEYLSTPELNSDVLTVSIPVGLQTTDLPAQGRIENEGTLSLNPLQSIVLQSNSLYNSGRISVPGGNVTLVAEEVALTDAALIDASDIDGGGVISVGGFQGQEPIAKRVWVGPGVGLVADAIAQGNGGQIAIRSEGATYFAGQASAQGGILSGDGGFVEVSGLADLAYQGLVSTQAFVGETGTLLLNSADIEVVEMSERIISLSIDDFDDPALSDGITRIAAGDLLFIPTNLSLEASRDITVNADVFLFQPGFELTARAGSNITLNRSIQAVVDSDIRFSADEDIQFNGANVFIMTSGGIAELNAGDTIAIVEGAKVSTASITGDGGNVTAQSRRVVMTGGASIDTFSQAGSGGIVSINAGDLILEEGSQISTSTLRGSRSGDINISATGDVFVSTGSRLFGDTLVSEPEIESQGADVNISASRLSVSESGLISNAAIGTGRSGDIDITTTELVSVTSNGFVTTGSALGSGDSGVILVRSPQILVDSGSITASSLNQGNAGSILLREVDNLTVRNGGEIGARAVFEDSFAGDVVIEAQTIVLEDGGSIETAAPSSNGGNIELTAERYILLRRGGLISAEAGTEAASELLNPTEGLGTGGNVTIRTPFLIAPITEDNDISANAFVEGGGQVTISAIGIFGPTFRSERSPNSDITASSEFGTDGIVTLNAPDTSFVEDNIAALSDTPIDASQLIAQSCIARARDGQGSFVVSGADGLQRQPDSSTTAIFSTGNVRSEQSNRSTVGLPEPVWQPGDPIAEPSGVFELSEGGAVLSHDCSR